MAIYSFYIFDRHCLLVSSLYVFSGPTANCFLSTAGESIYIKQWHERERAAASLRPATAVSATSPIPDKRTPAGGKHTTDTESSLRNGRLSVQDDAKLIFGVVFSLRNMVRKLSTPLVPHLHLVRRPGCSRVGI